MFDTTTGAQVAHEAVQGILNRVDALALKIGTTAQHVWEIYLAQARVEAIRDTVAAVLCLILSAILVRLVFFAGNRVTVVQDMSNSSDGGGWTAVVVVSAIPAIAFAVAFGVNIYNSIPEWLNPQYWAFQHLTADLKNLF